MLTPPTQKQQNEIIKLSKKYATLKENAWKDATDGKITLEAFNIANDSLNAELSYTIKEKNDSFDIQNIDLLCESGIKEPPFLSFMDNNDLTKDTDTNYLKLLYVLNFCLSEWVKTAIEEALDRFLMESERRKALGQPVEVKEALFQKYRGGIYKALDTRLYDVIKDDFKPLFKMFNGHGHFSEIEAAIKKAIRSKENENYVYTSDIDFKSFSLQELPTEILNISPSKDLFTIGKTDGQFSLFTGAHKTVYFAVYDDEKTPQELRELNPYDRRMYNAISTLYDKDSRIFENEHSKFKVVAFDNIFNLLTGKKFSTAADYQVNEMLTSLKRILPKRIDINNGKEVTYRKESGKKPRNYIYAENKPLLNADVIYASVNGKPTVLLAIYDEPILLEFMKSRKELVNIPVKALTTSNKLTDTNILIEDTLLDYIYRYTNTTLPNIAAFCKKYGYTRNKQRIVATFEKTLDYYKSIGIIRDYSIKDGEIKNIILLESTIKVSNDSE